MPRIAPVLPQSWTEICLDPKYAPIQSIFRTKFCPGLRLFFIFLRGEKCLIQPRLIWKGNSLGVCHKHFPRESGTTVIFPRGQGKFSRGVILVKTSLLVESHLENWFPMGRFQHHPPPPGIPHPKLNLENCLPYPCMAKKWNSQIAQ